MTAIPALYRAVGTRGETVSRLVPTGWDVRQRTLARIERAQREHRREYRRELLDSDLSAERRESLLAELAADQDERRRRIERGFDVAGVRGVAVP